ncbi:MAG: tetratricopeptide repeat protein [bacterium]
MIKGRLKDQQILTEINVSDVLKLAKQSHENYLIRDSKKDLESAIDYYLEAIKIDPSISEAYYKLASLLWEKGQIDINYALEQCEKAIKLDPDSSTARLYLGYFLRAAGRLEEAEKEFRSSIELNKIFSAKPRIALGTTIIQKIRTNKPNLAEFISGMYYFFSGIIMIFWDFGAVRVLYRSILEDIGILLYKFSGALYRKFKIYNQAIKIYENAAEKTGKTSIFYEEIGDLSLETGNYHLAVKYYRDALESSPDDIILWTKLVNTLQTYCKDDVDEITDCYNNLLELEPNNARIHYELGHLYLLEDKFSAVNAFRKATELEPDNAFYHNSLAYTLVQLEDYDGAISEYQKAIRLNPDNEWTSIVSQALGAIYHQVKNNTDAAIVSYQTAIILDPYNIDAFIAIGEAYQEKNDLTNAIDSYCEAIKLDPAVAKVYSNLGMALWERDYIEESIIAYQKAMALDPRNETVFNNLGVVYLDGVGKPEEALAMFSQAIKHNPNYAIAYYNKGRAYQIFGNKIEAAKYYQMAIDINRLTFELDETEIEKRIYNLFSVN